MTYKGYMESMAECISQVDENTVEQFAVILRQVKANRGRLFFLGVGGSAANCSHAVNDFRKIAGIDAQTPVDNVSELTAYTNDVSFADCFVESLVTSQLNSKDAICVFSVGGGSDKTSANIVNAIQFAKRGDAKVLGIVSRNGGFTKENADVCINFCPEDSEVITPIAESLQVVFFHYLVNAI